MSQKKQRYLLNKAEEVCNLLRKHIDQDHIVRIISHNDSDGISAAGIICNAISRENGKFHVTIVPRLGEKFIKKLSHQKYKVFIFCDMGSAHLDSIKRLKGDVIVADHHQIINQDKNYENIIHLNSHLFGVDGTREISASGISYLIVREMKNEDLANLALVGAFGDMQCKDGALGFNKMILDEGEKSGALEIRDDLRISYKKTEPLYRALAYTFNPVLPGISGDFDGSKVFLQKHDLPYGIKFTDLNNEEKDILTKELMEINSEVFGRVYEIPNESGVLRNIADYSNMLDACGKNKNYGIALSICLGERDGTVDKALMLLRKYKDSVIKGINWIKKEGYMSLDNVQYIYTDDKKKAGLMGTLSSIGIELRILDPKKPALGISKIDNNRIKISARTTMNLTEKGVNLGRALADASKNFGGTGGGHNIAAGAVVPYKSMTSFVEMVNEIVGMQLGN